MRQEDKNRHLSLFDLPDGSKDKVSSIKEEFPTLEDLMFRNKSAHKKAKQKKYYKNKYKK